MCVCYRRRKKKPQDRTPSMDFSPPNVRTRRVLPSPTPPSKKTQDFATGQNMHRSSQGTCVRVSCIAMCVCVL